MRWVWFKLKTKLFQGLVVGAVGAAVSLCLWGAGWLDPFEARTWDWRASLMAKPGRATDAIRLIFVDQNSLDWAKEEMGLTWPWPREVYGAVIDYCRQSGARAVAFDVLYTEPSKYGVEDDLSFKDAVFEFGRVAGSVFLGTKTGAVRQWPSEIPSPRLEIAGLKEWLGRIDVEGVVFPRATFPIPEVALGAAVLCNVQLQPDADGVYRRTGLFSLFDRKILPSLGLGVFLAADPDAALRITSSRVEIDGLRVPIDRRGNAVLRYRGPSGTHKNFSAAAVLQSHIRILSGQEPAIKDSQAFKDKYVFFGFSAPGLFDLRPAPVGGVYPGVEIHATLLDNLLSGDFIKMSPAWLTFVVVLLLTSACGVMTTFFSSPVGSIAVSAVFFSTPIFLSIAAYLSGLWMPLVVQEFGAVLAVALGIVFNYATEGRQKRFIKNAFQQYLSPAVIDQLIQHPERLKLGGERRVLSIFFSDLQGFTSISENLDPESLTALLNDYLSAMTDIIIEEGGTIDKYEGDAIIAFWNAPLEVQDHAVRVVRASLRCQARLAEMRPAFKLRIGKEMWMRIGINTGPAVVGNLGSHTRFDYTMLGDSVNLAARLEGANKQFGTYTMISQATRDTMGDAYPVRELARVAVVGKKEAVTVFEPMTLEQYESRKEVLNTFAKGLDHYYQGRFKEALEVFAAIDTMDPPAASYLQKCRELLAASPGKWNGVWVMSEK